MNEKRKLLGWAVAAVIAFLAVAFLAGCSPTTKIEKVYVHDTITNTNIVHDSVDRWRTHYEYVKGDSVFIIDTIFKSSIRKVHDTIVDVRHDVQVKEVEKITEKKVYVWWPAVVLIILAAGAGAYFWIRAKVKG